MRCGVCVLRHCELEVGVERSLDVFVLIGCWFSSAACFVVSIPMKTTDIDAIDDACLSPS